jgi:predicted O-methyltransferase YrrM
VFISYIKHLLQANTLHGTHSPFVYSFLENVVYKKSKHPSFDKIEKLRNKLLHNQNEIEINDFGAGSRIHKNNKRSISSIARISVKPKKYCELLYRICQWQKTENVLELGTSLGITSTYLSLAANNVITIEGCKNIASVAKQNFEKLNLNNIQLINNNFDNCLNIELEKIKSQKNLYYIDGNHKKDATIKYFETILQYATEADILIFDDIHWSKEMEDAWENICRHPKAIVTIDLFQLGIVFLHNTQVKENFKIRF